MERLQIQHTDDGILVDGFPEAVKVVRLTGPAVYAMADYYLHDLDLSFARACLDGMNTCADAGPVIQEALWRAAIIHFVKCFGESKARERLEAAEVYKDAPAAALEAFKFFWDLRRKHIVHDENSLSVSQPAAILNNGQAAEKVAMVACVGGYAGTQSPETYTTLTNLIEHARAWVASKFDAECSAVKADLERESYTALLAKEEANLSGFATADVRRKRPKP